jgi:hypothetical protein
LIEHGLGPFFKEIVKQISLKNIGPMSILQKSTSFTAKSYTGSRRREHGLTSLLPSLVPSDLAQRGTGNSLCNRQVSTR